jgi:exoribonuclease-2
VPAPAAEPWERAVLCLALTRDRERFRREGAGFVVLDAGERSQREARESQAREQREWMRLAQQWRPELERGRWNGARTPLGPEFLVRLRSLAALERHSPYWSGLAKPLGLHQHGEASVALRLKPWLEAAGAWPGWPDLWLERAAVRQAFPPRVLQEAARIAALPVDPKGRVERREPGAYTIDATNTFDYDDAYSVERAGTGGLVVCVHIADPHPDIAAGNPVFEEAGRRMSSVYSEAGVFPMLPPALSLGRFSLLRGRPREAVTCRFRVTEHGLEWSGLERSVIEVRENLDYEQASRLTVEQPETWGRLAAACAAQAQDRMRRGAFVTDRVEVQLDLSDPARIRLAVEPRSGPAQGIVEELAIAYNLAAGRLCRDARLPALYRVQQRPAPGRAAGAGLAGSMAHARFSTQGGPHEGLACERYVQATSPNRRFPDLVMQRQLAAHSSGRPTPFTGEQLAAWSDEAEARLSAYAEAERLIQQHWVRAYLFQNPGSAVMGTVRQVDSRGARIWLDELGLPAEAPPRRLDAGQRLAFRVAAVDVDRQRVQLVAP